MGTLYVVGTPIGNLDDISPRALDALSECDFIAAEDTRVTLKLLNHFEIKKPLVSYFEHNKRTQGEVICQRILAGEDCCIVTDAGMPAISDPGEDLVRQCYEKGIPVSVVPGPCAFVSALALSGMATKRFTFEGFLSVNKNSRREHLKSIVDEKRTLCFYEAPHKLARTLQDLYDYLGDRHICIVREITKIHEEAIHTTLEEASRLYADGSLKGEIVLIVEGAGEPDKEEYTLEYAVQQAEKYISEGMSRSEGAKKAAQLTGFKKSDIYALISQNNDRGE